MIGVAITSRKGLCLYRNMHSVLQTYSASNMSSIFKLGKLQMHVIRSITLYNMESPLYHNVIDLIMYIWSFLSVKTLLMLLALCVCKTEYMFLCKFYQLVFSFISFPKTKRSNCSSISISTDFGILVSHYNPYTVFIFL